jgi:hypothetical protein
MVTAIQDSFSKLIELNKIWSEVQYLYAEQIKDFRCIFESILGNYLFKNVNTQLYNKHKK